MAKGTSEAYDFSLFEPQPQLHAVKSPEKAIKIQEREDRRNRRKRTMSIVLIATLLVTVFALLIVSRVQLTELSDQISTSRDELAILQSETSRLTNELSAKTSAESVDIYARENGMEKIESHQIEYITVDGGDKIEVSDPAPDGFFETIGAMIAGWFDV